jgi:Ino eighty subunit 2
MSFFSLPILCLFFLLYEEKEAGKNHYSLTMPFSEPRQMDTINRLLKKQTPKRRGRIPVSDTAAEASPDVLQDAYKPDPIMIRWVSNHNISRVGVPGDLLGTPASRVFGHAPIVVRRGRRLVEEI